MQEMRKNKLTRIQSSDPDVLSTIAKLRLPVEAAPGAQQVCTHVGCCCGQALACPLICLRLRAAAGMHRPQHIMIECELRNVVACTAHRV